MTILSAVQAACTESLALAKPTTLFSSTAREHVELQAIANAAAEYIARDYDWQTLQQVATITGDGTTTAFDLPSDYDRMTTDAKLWSSALNAPLNHITSPDQWLGLQTVGTFTTFGSWILYGGQINIMPAPESGETVKYFYMSNLTVAPESGSNKTAFTLDTDTFRLSETLLKLCIVWLHKQSKGRQYAEEMATYEDQKARIIAKDAGAKMLRIGRPRLPTDVDIAYPINVGV